MENVTYFTVAELKKRGWTDTLVQKLLGEANATRPNPHFKSAARVRLYLQTRVNAIEQSEAWPALAQKASARRAAAEKGTQTKRENLLKYVDTVSIHVTVVSMDEATRSACENFNDTKVTNALKRGHYEFHEATLESDPLFLQRITVNYLRHGLTRYDHELGRLFGKVGVRQAYSRLIQKVFAAIAAAYPELAEECRRQVERKLGVADMP